MKNRFRHPQPYPSTLALQLDLSLIREQANGGSLAASNQLQPHSREILYSASSHPKRGVIIGSESQLEQIGKDRVRL